MCMERRRFSQTMLPNGKLILLSLTKCISVPHCRQELQQKSWKTARLSPRPRPRPNVQDQLDQDHDPRPRLSFLYSRRLETKTLVSRTTSLLYRAAREWQKPRGFRGVETDVKGIPREMRNEDALCCTAVSSVAKYLYLLSNAIPVTFRLNPAADFLVSVVPHLLSLLLSRPHPPALKSETALSILM